MKSFGIAALVVAAYVIGTLTPVSTASADAKNEPQALTVRSLTVVGPDGKTGIYLGAEKAFRGVWVNGLKEDTCAGIVANDNNASPYMHLYDYSKANDRGGCQFAVSVVDGEPTMQLMGKKRLEIFNPLDLFPAKDPKAPARIPQAMPATKPPKK